MSKVLITGATGMIGQLLCSSLVAKGHTINILTRTNPSNKKPGCEYFLWDVESKSIDDNAFNQVNAVIHLAGAGIADARWTKKRKREIINSRVESAALLVTKLNSLKIETDVFITASGANYYGTQTTEKTYKETDESGIDFLADCCVQWENAAFKNNPSKRVVALRTGVVLAKRNSALQKLAAPIKIGFGAVLGNGKQYVPWIHANDLVGIYCEALENNDFKGSYNAVSSEHVQQQEFTLAIAKVLGKKIRLPKVPSFALRLLLGEMSEVLLKGSKLSNNKILDTGFNFSYPKLDYALKDLLNTHE